MDSASGPVSLGYIVPHKNDVLLGRGGNNNKHVGNEMLRLMARSLAPEYCKATKKQKSNMSRELVHRIRNLSPPGRFLRKCAHSDEWEDAGDAVAREKVSQALRDAVSSRGTGGESCYSNDDDDEQEQITMSSNSGTSVGAEQQMRESSPLSIKAVDRLGNLSTNAEMMDSKELQVCMQLAANVSHNAHGIDIRSADSTSSSITGTRFPNNNMIGGGAGGSTSFRMPPQLFQQQQQQQQQQVIADMKNILNSNQYRAAILQGNHDTFAHNPLQLSNQLPSAMQIDNQRFSMDVDNAQLPPQIQNQHPAMIFNNQRMAMNLNSSSVFPQNENQDLSTTKHCSVPDSTGNFSRAAAVHIAGIASNSMFNRMKSIPEMQDSSSSNSLKSTTNDSRYKYYGETLRRSCQQIDTASIVENAMSRRDSVSFPTNRIDTQFVVPCVTFATDDRKLREVYFAEQMTSNAGNHSWHQPPSSSIPSLYQHIQERTRIRNGSSRGSSHAQALFNDRSSIGRSSMGGIETISNFSSNLSSEANFDPQNFDWLGQQSAEMQVDMS
mmetsp:Transcript_12531/g.23515  ORF Transcript_12531/g.23515 Transcript_12531/m.23515 type:complete len:552 (+) Transcript_12531:734-2389(+)|eukprot:CAMPEP_0176490676 /NCGR_PEP_ID=MMETSP0200_2-20121128/8000_1 /TAXON_ID=947934 /ORGANISM="Chaetoceros sp., Strain GSL56" /LENGTH=551 /DNA_ID=CAMNT_0017888003 /DNA_START=583 /DNA_END=2238 /DNA_ORIENTATION=+